MDIQNHPIGVLDSGLGGISVLRELVRLMPEEDYLYFGDSKNAPYGTKTAEEVLRLTRNTVSFLLEQGAKAIVVACNTATSVAIRELRQEYPSIPMIGIEPALKPAVEAKAHSTVLVMATPMTLKKEKFSDLMHRYESDAKIIKVPCPGLVELIEGGVLEGPQMEAYLQKVFAGFGKEHMDAVVLANYANEHAPFAIRAMRRGLHVFSEVLPCQTMKEAVELVEAVESSGRVYAYGENYCYMQAPMEMKRLYREGAC